jgi:methionyl-tRNA formyltransferase
MMPDAVEDILCAYKDHFVGIMPASPIWHVKKPLKAIYHTFNLFGVFEFLRMGFSQFLKRRTVASVCRQYRIEPLPFQSPNSAEFRDILAQRGVDILISYGCPIIIGKKTLEVPRQTSINVHGSYLPDFKGTYTVFYAMLRGAQRTGATVHRMSSEVDAGDYYYREQIPISYVGSDQDTLLGLYKKVERLGTSLLLKTLQDSCDGNLISYSMPPGGETVTFPRWQDGVEFRRKGLKYR